jgi:hypothetical protein
MTKLLIEEYPLTVQPTLAKLIGLNEAIFLQQLHYWLKTNGKQKDGKTWIYNSYDEWQEQLPFMSTRTLVRTVKSLLDKNLIIIGNYNKKKFDRTNWYTIDYDHLDILAPSIMTNWHKHSDKVAQPIPETSSETSQRKEKINKKEILKEEGTNPLYRTWCMSTDKSTPFNKWVLEKVGAI